MQALNIWNPSWTVWQTSSRRWHCMGGSSSSVLKVNNNNLYAMKFIVVVITRIYFVQRIKIRCNTLSSKGQSVFLQEIQLCIAWRLYGRSFQMWSILWVSSWYLVKLQVGDSSWLRCHSFLGRRNFYKEPNNKPTWWPDSVPFMPPNHCPKGKNCQSY